MIWFAPYKFNYFISVDKAISQLKEASQSEKWNHLVTEFSDSKIKIHHKLPVYFQNAWNPIFVGKFIQSPRGTQLKGYFRFNLVAMLLTGVFLLFSLFSIYEVWSMPDVIPGYIDGWKNERLEWEYQFLGFFLVIVIVGWGIGLINQFRIIRAIEESV